jgi:hypothetical protein
MTAAGVTADADTPTDDGAAKARGNVAWIVGSLVGFAGFVGLGHLVPATASYQPTVKAYLSFVTVVLAVVQIATISRVYEWTSRIPPGAVRTLAAVHRWSGRLTLLVGGSVMYLCITGPFTTGFTWHRLFGYTVAAVVLVKVVVLRVADRLSGLLPILGFLAAAGWVACFLTKGLAVIF